MVQSTAKDSIRTMLEHDCAAILLDFYWLTLALLTGKRQSGSNEVLQETPVRKPSLFLTAPRGILPKRHEIVVELSLRKELWSFPDVFGVKSLSTLSLPWRVINFKFLLQLTRNIVPSHSMKNLAFHNFLRWKMIISPILTTSLNFVISL